MTLTRAHLNYPPGAPGFTTDRHWRAWSVPPVGTILGLRALVREAIGRGLGRPELR